MRHRALNRRREDAGFSLAELAVSTTLIAMLCVVIGSITVSSLRAMRIANSKIAAGADVRVAMEAMSRTLRVAVTPTGEPAAITVGRADAVTFYTLLDGALATPSPSATIAYTPPIPTRVEYYRDAGTNCLMEAKTPGRLLSTPSGSGSLYAWDTGRTAKCLVRTAQVPTASSPWFSYFTTGQLTSGGAPTTPLTVPSGGLAESDRLSVRSVAVTVTVTDPANPAAGGVSDEFRVNLGNVSLSNGGGA